MLTLMIMLAPSIAMACLWIYGTTLDGKYVQREGYDLPSPVDLEARIHEQPQQHPSLNAKHLYSPPDAAAKANDEAVQVLLKGDAAKAVSMLEKVEAEHPGIYFTAANRGTALELAGRDEEALHWILEGIRRNPDSHMGAEWLHARILEAKLQLAKDPGWLKTHTITGIDLTRLAEPDYAIDSAQGPQYKQMIRDSLVHQLSARMLFVKPQDSIVAQLLIELTHMESQVGFLEYALRYLDLAELYGADTQAHAALRESFKQSISKAAPVMKTTHNFSLFQVSLIASFTLLLLACLFRKTLRQHLLFKPKSVP